MAAPAPTSPFGSQPIGIGGVGTGFTNLGDMISPPPPPGAPSPLTMNGNAPSTFTDPAASGSAWTGVSSNADPYGVHGVGYDLTKTPTGVNSDGTPQLGNLSREQLLGAGGYQAGEGVAGSGNKSNTSFLMGALPDAMKFSGNTPWENQNAPDGSALGSDAAQIQAQTTNSQNNMNAMQSSYPAYGNQYGLGGQISPPSSTGASTSPAGGDYSGGQGVTVNVPDTSSRGFNPWSIQGESNARDTSKGVSI